MRREIDLTPIIIGIIAIIIVAMASCRTSGYGCDGKQTWKQMVKRIN